MRRHTVSLADYRFFSVIVVATLVAVLPDCAFASGGITEFSSPLEKVVNTVTGPAGKYISIVAMAIAGLMYVFNKDDISGAFKILLQVVIGISFICFAGSVVNSVFSFSGALLG